MKPAPFDYIKAGSVQHAVTQLAEANGDGEGKIIAGGQSLVPLLALRLAQPSVLIDINRVPGLAEIIPLPGGGLRIGALTRHRALAAQSEHRCSPRPPGGSGTPPSGPVAPSAAAWPTRTRPPNCPSRPLRPARSR